MIDPKKTIRLVLTYPVCPLHPFVKGPTKPASQASTGRQFNEILRVIDSLQLGDANKITTPVNWVPGGKVIVHPSVSTEDARKMFKNGVEVAKPYLRFTTRAALLRFHGERVELTMQCSLNDVWRELVGDGAGACG